MEGPCFRGQKTTHENLKVNRTWVFGRNQVRDRPVCFSARAMNKSERRVTHSSLPSLLWNVERIEHLWWEETLNPFLIQHHLL